MADRFGGPLLVWLDITRPGGYGYVARGNNPSAAAALMVMMLVGGATVDARKAELVSPHPQWSGYAAFADTPGGGEDALYQAVTADDVWTVELGDRVAKAFAHPDDPYRLILLTRLTILLRRLLSTKAAGDELALRRALRDDRLRRRGERDRP
jgi:hypothetical protein